MSWRTTTPRADFRDGGGHGTARPTLLAAGRKRPTAGMRRWGAEHAIGSAWLAVAVGLLMLLSGCRPAGPAPEVRAFWSRFLATNSAWLDPKPGSMSYEYTLHAQEYAPSNQSYFWHQTGTLRTWYTPEKNVRIMEETRPYPGAQYRTNELRYCRGMGGRVSLKPGGRTRALGLDVWLAARTGTGFLSYLHLCAAWGLPATASLRHEPKPGTSIILTFTNTPGLSRDWHREVTVHPAYGLHPAVFASEVTVVPEVVVVELDEATLLPRSIVEIGHQGRIDSRVQFESPWLELGGLKVPGRVRCKLPAQQYELTYDFAVEEGVWLLKEFTRTHATGYSLHAKARLESVVTGSIPDAQFPGPADLAIPDHSVTTLAPGEQIIRVRTPDGLELEGKLSLPPDARQPVPIVFFLPGAGPWTFDRPLVYPDFARPNEIPPPMKVFNYCDFFARELAARGIGLFRMNKRGCGIVQDEEGHPREICNRSVFSKATPAVLLADYRAGLMALRQQTGVDPGRVVLMGASEGTRLATRLAGTEPGGVVAVVMFGYAGDNTHDTVVWQNTVGPWRNVAKLFDDDNDGLVTRQEYDAAVERAGNALAQALPFAGLDRDRNGTVTPQDMNHEHRLKELIKAVKDRDDDYLWENLLQLSTAYLLEEWEAPPLHQTLLKLPLPLAIFHGENDGSCRVECAIEAQRALQKAGRTNLFVRVYPKTDHDLNWARYLRDGKTPEAFGDIFDFIETQCRNERR